MRTKKALFNVSGLVVSEMVIFASGLILPRLILVSYGSLINGLLSSVRQILLYLRYLEMGLAGAATLALYKPLATGEDNLASQVLSTSRSFFVRVGVFFTFGTIVVAVVYPFAVPCDGLSWPYVAALVVLLGTSGAAGFFLVSSLRVLLVADQRSYVISLVAAGSGVLTLGATIGVIRAGCDVIIVPVVSTLGVLLQAWLLHVFTRRIYCTRFRFDLPKQGDLIPQRNNVFINEVALMVQVNSPVILITFMLGLFEVSVFAIYAMVFRSMQSLVRMLARNLRASFGEIIALGQVDRLRQAYGEYEYIIFFLTGWFYTCAGILLLSFVRIYTHGISDANYIRPTLGGFFLAAGVVRQIHVPCSTIIGAAGRYLEIRSNSVQVAAISVLLGIVGARCWGLEGVLLGLVLASTYKTIFTVGYAYRDILGRSPRIVVGRIARNAAFVSIAWAPFAVFIDVSPNTMWMWFLWALGVFGWVGVILGLGNAVSDWTTTRAILERGRMLLWGSRKSHQ